MSIQPETHAATCLLTLACAGILWQPAAAAEPPAEILANTAVASPARPRSGSLIGVTLAPGGLSLAAATVVIRSVSGATARQLISDTDGDFSARDLPPGMYEITGSKEGFAILAGATVEVAANKTVSATVQFTQGLSGSLRGVAVRPDGFSIADVSISLHSLAGSIDRNLATDADGMFIARDLPPGPYQIVATKPGYSNASPPVIVEVVKNRTANASVLLADAKPIPIAQATPAQAHANRTTAPVPVAVPAVDNRTPFAFGDFTWLNGSPRTKDVVGDTPFFTPEVRFDTHYVTDFNQPIDHTIVGSTELFRSGEVQIEQASVGGDFHWQNVRGRILFMQGLFATTTPRNDASSATFVGIGNTGGVGQWDLQNAYKYVSEAWGGYHFNVQHGLNVDAGIFVSYIGLFSYYNFDNWTYQPSYVSSNTPWFFNGVRAQWFPTNKLKIEPWFINGWQSYAKFNSHPGLGGQILWMPKEWFKLVANQYGFGQDNLGLPHTERIHTDDSIEVRYYNNPQNLGLSKMAFSLTGDAGCQYGGGITCHRGPNKSSFLGWMLYNRMWFHKNLFALTMGGGMMNNPGRYLTLLPPINGAWAASGTPYFTENPGDKAHMWDSTINFQYMPRQYITWWVEVGYRHSDVPYFAGRGGVTPPGGNNGFPQFFTCSSGKTSGTADLAAAEVACGGGLGSLFFPDLRRSEAKIYTGILVKF